MGLARTWSVGLRGVIGDLVEVECDISQGLPRVTLVGLPDAAVQQARDRVRAALTNSGEPWPSDKVTFNLSPAGVPKQGSGFDLSLALALSGANDRLAGVDLSDMVFIGELGLDGRIRPVRGVLPSVLAAAKSGRQLVVVPRANAAEAALVRGIAVLSADRLTELLAHLRGEEAIVEPAAASPVQPNDAGRDLAEVAGQAVGRRALEIAAAGGHHLFFSGPPGSGKTMLAERLPGLLPSLGEQDALEVTAIHSLAGTLPAGSPLLGRPPYEAPHHSASAPALVGGGSGLARPGAISRAHLGVLFLDEAPEFSPRVLDSLRQPLEGGEVVLQRSGGITTYPARFQLLMAANPCPCASPAGDQACICPSMVRRRYLSRLSGPLLDRVDLHVTLLSVPRQELFDDLGPRESTATVAARVLRARQAAAQRWRTLGVSLNADVSGTQLRDRWRPTGEPLRMIERALDLGVLSARGVDRVLRVSWTLADLAGRTVPGTDEVSEAVGMRTRKAVAA